MKLRTKARKRIAFFSVRPSEAYLVAVIALVALLLLILRYADASVAAHFSR